MPKVSRRLQTSTSQIQSPRPKPEVPPYCFNKGFFYNFQHFCVRVIVRVSCMNSASGWWCQVPSCLQPGPISKSRHGEGFCNKLSVLLSSFSEQNHIASCWKCRSDSEWMLWHFRWINDTLTDRSSPWRNKAYFSIGPLFPGYPVVLC